MDSANIRTSLRGRRTNGDVKGFSLAEIAAVVAIVAILMAIAIPAALNQKKKSIEGSQQADLMGAVTGVEKILTGYKGAPPTPVIITTCGNQWTAQTYTTTGSGAWPTACTGTALTVTAPIATLGSALETGKTTGSNIVGGGTSNTDGTVTAVPIAIGTNGAYCVQVSNTNATNTLRYKSDTRAVETGACPAVNTITGVGAIPTGVAANTPVAPSGLSATSPSNNTVVVNWAQLSPTPSGYTVSVGGINQDVASGTTLTATLTNVPGGAQTVTLRARNGSGVGAPATTPITVLGAAEVASSLSVSQLYVPPSTGNGAILGGTQYVAVEYNGTDSATANTPGYMIKTKIPYNSSSGVAYPTVELTGYALGGSPGNTVPQTAKLQLSWYVNGTEVNGVNCQTNPSGSMCFTNVVYTNSGAWNPGTVTLVKLTDGNVGIHLQNISRSMRFAITATASQNSGAVTSAWLQGWTVDNTNGLTTANVATADAVKNVTATSQPVYGATGPTGPAGPAYTPTALTWTSATLSAPWGNFDTYPCNTTNGYNCAGYTKTADGTVMLRGLVKTTGDPTNSTIFNLPVGYRPLQQNYFLVGAGGQTARVNVFPNGNVVLVSYGTGGNSNYVSLDSINFTTQ